MKQGWENKHLGEISEIINGGTPDTSERKYWDGEILWITPKDMGKLNGIFVSDTERKITETGLKNSSAKILPVNSIILSSRAPIGHLAINKMPISTNQGCKGIIPENNLNPLYLYYFLKHSTPLLNELGSGTTFKELSGSKLAEVIVPLPPLSEQQRIVAILDQAFDAIARAKANIEKNLANARELFESTLNANLSNLNMEWENKKLGEIFEIERGGSPRPISSYLTKEPNGVNWIKIGDTKGITKYIYKTEEKIRPEGVRKSRMVYEGDFILSNSMSFGRPYIMKTTGCIHDGWLVLRAKTKNIDQDFLYYVLGSNLIFSQFDKLAAGSTVRNLNIGLVKSVTIPLPPLGEQQTIVTRLEVLSAEVKKLEALYQQKLADLDELKRSILQKAFNGEL
jgi:type I restriction enzyme S subunit